MRTPKVSRLYLPNEEKQQDALKLLVRFDKNCRQGPADLGKIGAGPETKPPQFKRRF